MTPLMGDPAGAAHTLASDNDPALVVCLAMMMDSEAFLADPEWCQACWKLLGSNVQQRCCILFPLARVSVWALSTLLVLVDFSCVFLFHRLFIAYCKIYYNLMRWTMLDKPPVSRLYAGKTSGPL